MPTSAARDEQATAHASGEETSDRAGEDADEEDEAAREPCGGRRHALALEERDDPVPRDHGEAERRSLQDADRQERSVAKHPRAGVADAREAGRKERRDGGENREERCAPVRRTPARRVREGRHDHEREPAARHRRAAVEALERGASATCPDEVEPGDEGGARADSDHGATEERELDAGIDEQDPVADDRGGDRDEGDALRSVPVRAAPGRQLHGEVRDEQRGRQEPDGRERDAVVLGERVGDGADVRDVPGQAATDGESRDDADRAILR